MMRETKSRPPMKRLQWKCPRSKGRKKQEKNKTARNQYSSSSRNKKPYETNTPLRVVKKPHETNTPLRVVKNHTNRYNPHSFQLGDKKRKFT